MFEMNKPKKSLIIVYSEKTQKQAMYLNQLMSLKDDEEDGTTIGVKDGIVTTALWTEKEYECNRAQLATDSTLIVFIGHSKLADAERENMNILFDRYGMSFASLGTHAVIQVENKPMNGKDYKEFLEFAESYKKEIENRKAFKNSGLNALIVGVGLFIPFLVGIPAILYGLISIAKNNEKIYEQRFNFLVLYSYLNLMNGFVGE